MTACAVPVYTVVTPAMGDVLSAIATYRYHFDTAPSVEEIAFVVRNSEAYVHGMLAWLRQRGLVAYGRVVRLTGRPFVVVSR